jgi:eukaryotic-like serine/threonine-protein kinase
MPLPMALTAGTKLGPYEIVGPLGAGGMGEVYRARDSRLGRDVALKILPPQVTADADRVARFQREARLLASLNHPHIGAIYGVEDAGTTPALVLELVEGDTLDNRVRRGRLPVSESLAIAQQIADALDAAHSVGIIHRDLKPANIKITPDGVVKVLDFGLGKALFAEEPGSDQSTRTSRATIAGAILGTAAYMSPEQARGYPVDKRTDIWAFGCVLFEMLTGTSAFGRATTTDTVAALISAEPEWKSLPAGTPAGVRRLLMRCLQKDAKRRLHDIADARIELEETIAAPGEPDPTPTTRPWLRWAIFASLGFATALALLWMARRKFEKPIVEQSPLDARVIRLTNLPGLEESPAISPDGKSVAFTAGVGDQRQIFVQLIAGGAPLQVTHDPVDHQCPRWSPDSSSIFYFSPAVLGTVQGSILEVSALGGVPRRVVNSIGCADVEKDGRLVLFRLATEGIQLGTSPADASRFDVIAQFAPATYYLYPRWSPDGRWIAFQRGDSIRFDIFVTAASGGQPRQLTHDNDMMAGFAWLPDSTGIVYSTSRGGTMPYLPALGLYGKLLCRMEVSVA